MPNPSFFNLSEDKRNLVLSVSLKEFSTANYDKASINQICKNSNIAKGSFYQYFTDKLDLYVYVMTLAVEAKITFFSESLGEFKSLPLLEQINMLFLKGVEFARNYPQYAALGEQFSKENNETAKQAVMKEGDKQSESLFAQMIEHAKAKEEIDNNIDTVALSLMLQALNKTVNDYMLNKFGDISYQHFDEDADKLVHSLLGIIFNGIKNK
ncbi:TetR/AcrR family transcriptional regulator [Anaerocolumna sp. AGMB13025]|uniref:TetR/AcrR family transcriptional regulator n=1 Tax=Anaerocolumna sp. AGMB13025 TaxID=3039116 RepID=UPI00241CCC84|nr:TetR/AcrR family transcriptional regulator [Anaerocolumna sp. AGMB13025]WFR56503.1 TetR/AcrR family transcriptional regulator [Anaerocolumna sp. AGMB13025]